MIRIKESDFRKEVCANCYYFITIPDAPPSVGKVCCYPCSFDHDYIDSMPCDEYDVFSD